MVSASFKDALAHLAAVHETIVEEHEALLAENTYLRANLRSEQPDLSLDDDACEGQKRARPKQFVKDSIHAATVRRSVQWAGGDSACGNQVGRSHSSIPECQGTTHSGGTQSSVGGPSRSGPSIRGHSLRGPSIHNDGSRSETLNPMVDHESSMTVVTDYRVRSVWHVSEQILFGSDRIVKTGTGTHLPITITMQLREWLRRGMLLEENMMVNLTSRVSKDHKDNFMRSCSLTGGENSREQRKSAEEKVVSFRDGGDGGDGGFALLLPQSRPRLLWDVLGIIVVSWDIIVTPLHLLWFGESELFETDLIDFIVNIFWTVDIALTFRTGYYWRGRLMMQPAAIAKRYVRTWLLFDVLIVLPEWAALLANTVVAPVTILRVVRLVRFLRLLRVAKVQRIWHDVMSRINSPALSMVLRLCVRIAAIACSLHILACCWHYLGTTSLNGWIDASLARSETLSFRYAVALNFVCAMIHGYSNVYPITLHERVFSCATSMICLVTVALFVSSTTNMLRGDRYFKAGYYERAVKSFLQRHSIESSLAVRMQKVVADESRLLEQREQDDQVVALLPINVLKDLQLQVRGTKFRRRSRIFSFLGDLYPHFFRQMCFEAVHNEYARETDILFHADEVCGTVRCVAAGELEYYLTDDSTKEVVGERVSRGKWISELAFWTSFKHFGKLEVNRDCWVLSLKLADFDHAVTVYKEVHYSLALYAKQALLYVNSMGCASDVLGNLPTWVWEEDYFDNTTEVAEESQEVQLPWRDELPSHLTARVCTACLQMAKRIVIDGLDENRPHHGFTVIIGDTQALALCGQAGFNPFQGHEIYITREDGCLDEESFDILRRNAFHCDGSIIIDGCSGMVKACGWFVRDIIDGGHTGGARTRAAKAVAQQAQGCYVIKCSEDSNGELSLHYKTKRVRFSGEVEPHCRESEDWVDAIPL